MLAETNSDLIYNVFVEALSRIVGEDSYVYRDIRKALKSDDQLDLYLAEDAFNSLPKEKKIEIQYLVKKLASDVHAASRRRTGEQALRKTTQTVRPKASRRFSLEAASSF